MRLAAFFGLLIGATMLALAGAGCSRSQTHAASPADSVHFTACRVKGIEIALRCTDLTVVEDRERSNDPTARRIAIHVVVIPALARKAEPDAVFVLAGGPGQSATDVAGSLFPLLARLGRDRDVVLVDQRGTGQSNPLSCARETSSENIKAQFDPADMDTRVAACAQRLAARADLTRYTTTIAMQDLDDVRARLGYGRIDLWGGSYGTRAALEYARLFPERLRTMTLDGVAPAWQKLPLSFGVDTDATLIALVGSCAHDAVCAKRYPALGADVDALIAMLGTGRPVARFTQPVTGEKIEVPVTRAGLAALLRTPLYASLTASLLPAAIDQAAHGDFGALGALTFVVGSGIDEHLALGMHLSVVCAEDVPAITAAEVDGVRAEAAKSRIDGRPNPFAAVYLDQYRHLCAAWPARPVAPDYFTSLAGKPGARVPTLLLSGGIDPATPPAEADRVARVMTNARHLIAPNVAHGVSLQGCAPELIERFIRTADPKTIDGACLAAIPRPPFYVPLVDGARDNDTVTIK